MNQDTVIAGYKVIFSVVIVLMALRIFYSFWRAASYHRWQMRCMKKYGRPGTEEDWIQEQQEKKKQ